VFEHGCTRAVGGNATLDGITLLGPLTANGATVYFKNGLAVKTATKTTPGTIDLSVTSSALPMVGHETLDNVGLLTASNGANSTVYVNTGAETPRFGQSRESCAPGK
jgi:hypothetical protein